MAIERGKFINMLCSQGQRGSGVDYSLVMEEDWS